MPFTVSYSFDVFLDNITVSGDHRTTANTRRDAIVAMLKDRFAIAEAFPMGSLARGTALRGYADADVAMCCVNLRMRSWRSRKIAPLSMLRRRLSMSILSWAKSASTFRCSAPSV